MGHPQQAIAEVVGVHQATVSRVLTALDDTRFFAKALLHAAALPIAEATIDGVMASAEMGKPQPGIRVLEDLGVLPRGNARAAGPDIDICVGEPGSPAGEDPFDDEVIDVESLPIADLTQNSSVSDF